MKLDFWSFYTAVGMLLETWAVGNRQGKCETAGKTKPLCQAIMCDFRLFPVHPELLFHHDVLK